MGGQNSGGSRMGQAGKVYTNRTDLANKRINQAPSAVPPPPPQGPASSPGGPNATPTQDATPPTPDQIFQTQRPNEPITAGLPTGPGPGPEVLPQPMIANQIQTVSQLLSALASNPNASPATKFLASYVNQGPSL